jgi:hypothetical protein
MEDTDDEAQRVARQGHAGVEERRAFLLATLAKLKKELDELPPQQGSSLVQPSVGNATGKTQPQDPEWVTIRAEEYRLLQLQARAMDVVQEGRRGQESEPEIRTFWFMCILANHDFWCSATFYSIQGEGAPSFPCQMAVTWAFIL